MWNAGLDEAQAGIKIVRRNINIRYTDDIILMAKNEEELKSFLMKNGERGEWKSWLKTQHSYVNMNPPQVYTCSPSWTPLPPPSLYHPSGSSQGTSPQHPVSCIKPGLAIRFIYDIIHVSMPFSQIIPPSPSPTESKDCSIHLCLFCCLAYRLIVTIFLNSIYMC